MIGIDGANWQTLDPLIEEGKLPFFKKLKESSSWAYLQTIKPTKSSIIWTSIATGKSMVKHGIVDFAFAKKNGIKVPYTNAEKRAPSIWQILDDYGKKSIVLNWFSSYPPDKLKNGIIVSDVFRNVAQNSNVSQFKDSIYPPKLFKKLVSFKMINIGEILKFIGIPDYPKVYEKIHAKKSFKKVPILRSFYTHIQQEFLVYQVNKYIYNHYDFDFYATYFRMTDLTQHFSLRMFNDKEINWLAKKLKTSSLTPEEEKMVIRKISKIIEPVYKFAERILKEMLTNPNYKDAYFIILSDHGFSLYPGGFNHYGLPKNYPPPPGILIIKGPDVKPGKLKRAHVYDIAPTILYIYGLPIGKNMDGRILKDAFKFSRKKITYRVYNLKEKIKASRKHDKDVIKDLKTIGYL